MKSPLKPVILCIMAMVSGGVQAYSYFTCSNGQPLDFGGGHMTFNYANNLSAAQKDALSLGHERLTAFSDSSITIVDNADSDFGDNNGENEIYLDNSLPSARCTFWYFDSSCTVQQADMQYGNQAWVTTDNSGHLPYASGRSITGTAIHEAGHCLGMAHTNNLANMMGVEYSYVTRQGIEAFYGPGEDLSDGLINLHGEKSGGLDTYRDVGATVMRYSGFSGEYSTHTFGVLRDYEGSVLPAAGSYVGQPSYQAGAGALVEMEVMLENNGEADIENPGVGVYLSDNDIISATDTLLDASVIPLGRDAPLETSIAVTIPPGTSPGNYFLGVYVDHDNQIAETTVANNAAYYPLTVGSPVPSSVTGAPTDTTPMSVTLNGTVNPNGLSTTVYFDYGTTNAYGNTLVVGNIGAAQDDQAVQAAVGGLTCNTLYHYRVRGTNSSGTGLGSNGSFTTGACSTGC